MSALCDCGSGATAAECMVDDCHGMREFKAKHGFEQACEMIRNGRYNDEADYYYAANWVLDELERKQPQTG